MLFPHPAIKDVRLSLPQSTVYFCLGNVSQSDFSAANLDTAIETILLYDIPTVNVKCSGMS